MGKVINPPSKEDILRYYIQQNHTQSESASHFGVSVTKFSRFKRLYGISKPKELVGAKKKAYHEARRPRKPEESELRRLYLDELMTKAELAARYRVPESRIVSWLKESGITKSRELTQETINRNPPKKTEEAKRKTRETNLRKYGCDNPSKSPLIKKRISDAESAPVPPADELRAHYIGENLSIAECARLYGVGRNLIGKWLSNLGIKKSREAIQRKREATCLKKYGASNPNQSPDIQSKKAKRNMEKYGVPNPASAHVNDFETWSDRQKFEEYLRSFSPGKPTLYSLAEHFNVHHSGVASKIKEWGLQERVDLRPLRSKEEKEIVDVLVNEIGIPRDEIVLSDRKTLDGQEIDIYLPSRSFGIEFNGDYWHSDRQPKYQDHGGRTLRHQAKTLMCESKGITLFHIFEHEWCEEFIEKNPKFKNSKENIKNRLKSILGKNSERIAARKCEVREVPEEDRKAFMDANHIQGAGLPATVCLGLYLNGELVSCMAFRRSKSKKYDWELSRFCSKHGTEVQGGASKLFSHFAESHLKPGQKVVSFSDLTKATGAIYPKLGFECVSVGPPNYWWVNLSTYDVRSRYQEQAAGEAERMHSLGYSRVCDCGTKTWVYEKG